MKACSVETVGCQSIWIEMENTPVVTNIVHFGLRPLTANTGSDKKGGDETWNEERKEKIYSSL